MGWILDLLPQWPIGANGTLVLSGPTWSHNSSIHQPYSLVATWPTGALFPSTFSLASQVISAQHTVSPPLSTNFTLFCCVPWPGLGYHQSPGEVFSTFLSTICFLLFPSCTSFSLPHTSLTSLFQNVPALSYSHSLPPLSLVSPISKMPLVSH